jgi:hypothetical protein
VVERNVPRGGISLGEMPWWTWAVLAVLLALLFMGLTASSNLLAPLVGQAAGFTDYLHEFTHDGRHLLAVPCH